MTAKLAASRGRMLTRGPLLVLLVLIFAIATSASASAKNGKVLILEPTVSGGSSSLEAQAAEAAGEGVEVVPPSTWESLSAAQFAEYDAIVIGDPTCADGPEPIEAASKTAATWNPVIDGNIILIGTDPVFHAPSHTGAGELIKRGMAFVLEKKGFTGGYLDLSCYYHEAGAGTPVPMLEHLSPFGSFTVYGQNLFSSCPAASHIVATSPALEGLTDEALSNWSCSAHEAFEEWPADFQVLAINKDIGSNYTASDGTTGGPYILARGVTVISDISLTPLTAENPLGAPHTLTAAVTHAGAPIVGTTVTFTVIAGPNKGVTGTGVTNAEGKATFTYTSSLLGTDVIHATFVNDAGLTETSNTAEKTWVTPPPPPPPPPPPAPKAAVLAFGSAHLAASRACVASTGYVASISGKAIKSVTYTLDGHKLKTLTKAKHGSFALRIKISAGRAHHLSIHVAFTAASHTKAVTIKRTLARCAAVKKAAPRFTG